VALLAAARAEQEASLEQRRAQAAEQRATAAAEAAAERLTKAACARAPHYRAATASNTQLHRAAPSPAEEHRPAHPRSWHALGQQGGTGAGGGTVDTKMKAVFDKYDADSSGNIDKAELKQAVQSLGFTIADARCGRRPCRLTLTLTLTLTLSAADDPAGS
jgi:hypothetical protein